MRKEHWKDQPDEHDFPAAADYLSLVAEPGVVDGLVAALREAALTSRKAKDLLRASRLALLKPSNAHVQADLAKIKRREKLSPVLLVRGDAKTDRPLIVADGYHRICASYYVDENAAIPCRIVDLPAGTLPVRKAGVSRANSLSEQARRAPRAAGGRTRSGP